jgi:hypothetical protein
MEFHAVISSSGKAEEGDIPGDGMATDDNAA